MKVDFHIHTNYSDGGMSFQEVIDECIKNNVKFISVTDHNTFKSCFDNLAGDIKLINGMELDVKYENTIFHMLLYNFDLKSKLLQDYYKKNRRHEIYQFNKKIKELESIYNLKIDRKDKIRFIRNNNYFDRIRLNNFLVEVKLCADAREAYHKYTNVLKSTKRMHISMDELFKLAIDANAVVSMAHPLTYGFSLSDIENIILDLRKKYDLKVIEAINNHQTIEDEKELIRFCKQNNFYISSGSDVHYKFGISEKKTVGTVLNHDITDSEISFLELIMG